MKRKTIVVLEASSLGNSSFCEKPCFWFFEFELALKMHGHTNGKHCLVRRRASLE